MSTKKYDALFVRLNGKNYFTWTFQFRIFVKGKELWDHFDGIDFAPDKTTHKEARAKWEIKDAQVMTWIIGFVEPNIVLDIRPFTTARKMWD